MSSITVTHAPSGLVHANVARSERVTPHMVRVTLTGDDLRRFDYRGFDQWFRLAVPVDDHELDHATYEDDDKRIADTGWWELEDRNDRRQVFVLHGGTGSRRYALIDTGTDALLHLVKEQPAGTV